MKDETDPPLEAGIEALFARLLGSQCGASAIEMGLICSLIVLAMMTALENFGSESQNIWNSVTSKSAEAISQSGGA